MADSLILEVPQPSAQTKRKVRHPFGLNAPPSDRYVAADGTPVPSVSEILRDLRFSNFSGVPDDILRRKAAIGTKAHKAIEKLLVGKDGSVPDSVPDADRVRAYVSSWHRWRQTVDIVPILLEHRVILGNLYAGTFDCLCYLNGKLSLIDWKTRRAGSYWYDAYQTAGYVMLAAGADDCPAVSNYNVMSVHRYVLALTEDGSDATLTHYDDPADFNVWSAAVCVWWARARAK